MKRDSVFGNGQRAEKEADGESEAYEAETEPRDEMRQTVSAKWNLGFHYYIRLWAFSLVFLAPTYLSYLLTQIFRKTFILALKILILI